MAKIPKAPPLPPEVLAWRALIKPLKRYGISLLDQQLWCWGCDIKQADNLLLRYGFTRFRQDKEQGGSVYSLALEGEAQVRLWGGNIVYIDPAQGALHMKRYEFEPRLLSLEVALGTAAPDGSTLPQTADECARLATLSWVCLRWIAGYERWVLEAAGREHRERSVAAWKTNAVTLIPVDEMAQLWQTYGDEIALGVMTT